MTAPSPIRVVPHLKLTWGGDLGVPATEIWSNGLAFAQLPADAAPSAAELDAIVDAVATPLRTWMSGASACIARSANMTWTKAVWVNANRKQRDTNTSIHDFAPAAPGFNQASPIWEQSYAITLRSELNRGRGHAGRIYPPVSGLPPSGTTPYLDKGTADAMAATFALLLDQLKTAIDGVLVFNGGVAIPGNELRGMVPVIISAGNVDTGVVPLATAINRVVVDRVADIQHRRTNRVPRLEADVAPFPPAG